MGEPVASNATTQVLFSMLNRARLPMYSCRVLITPPVCESCICSQVQVLGVLGSLRLQPLRSWGRQHAAAHYGPPRLLTRVAGRGPWGSAVQAEMRHETNEGKYSQLNVALCSPRSHLAQAFGWAVSACP
jgi:hypothetical protein